MSALPVQIVGGGIDWPAWIQGVGSVLAIIAGFGLAGWEAHRIRRADSQKTGNLQKAGLSLMEAHQAALKATTSFLLKGHKPPPGILLMLEKQFQAFPAHLLDDAKLYRLLVSGWANIVNTLEILDTVSRDGEDAKKAGVSMNSILEQGQNETGEYKSHLRTAAG